MPVSLQSVTVHPRDLDVSGAHLLWAEEPSPALSASLEACGQMVPLLVDFEPQRPVLVAGYKRVLALRALRRPALALGFFPQPGLDPGLAWAEAYLAANQAQPPDEARLVRAVRFFTARGGFAAFLAHAAPHLGLAPRDKRLDQLQAWTTLPAWLDGPAATSPDHAGARTLSQPLAPLSLAPRLAALPENDLAALRPFLEAVRFSRNHLDNLLTWLGESALARRTSLADLLDRPECARALETGLAPSDRLARLAQAARRLRNPALVDLEERFAKGAKALTAGTRFKVLPSPGFETDAVRLEVSLAAPRDLARAARDLETLRSRPQWEDLWGAARPAPRGEDS
ncbi:hypothetical protein JCM15519_19770 [Fundidesulfovibrio butyratiphilus]